MSTANIKTAPSVSPQSEAKPVTAAALPSTMPAKAQTLASPSKAMKPDTKTAVQAAPKTARQATPKTAPKAAPKAASEPAHKTPQKAAAPARPAAKAKPLPAAKKPETTASKASKSVASPAPQLAKSQPTSASKTKVVKEKKVKVIRDSFTIPKTEFEQLAVMKKRATTLGVDIKKSELIRAGLQLLNNQPDKAFTAALASVPTIKTGRPSKG